MSNFRPFFDFSQIILSEVLHVNCNSIEKHCPVFFWGRFVFRIREITYAKNCVFHCVHKEIDNAFSPGDNFRKHSSFAYVISRIRNTNRPKKKLDNVFQSNCSSHAELLTNLRKIEKRPKIRHKAVMHPALQLNGTFYR